MNNQEILDVITSAAVLNQINDTAYQCKFNEVLFSLVFSESFALIVTDNMSIAFDEVNFVPSDFIDVLEFKNKGVISGAVTSYEVSNETN